MKTLIACSLAAAIALVPVRFAVAQTDSPAAVPKPQQQVPQQLVIEVEVPAPVGEVWHAFSTSEGLSTWLTPNAVVDLRPGGSGRRIFRAAAPGAEPS